jgi:hypothetical protein
MDAGKHLLVSFMLMCIDLHAQLLFHAGSEIAGVSQCAVLAGW